VDQSITHAHKKEGVRSCLLLAVAVSQCD
jgi:hypothetical protein